MHHYATVQDLRDRGVSDEAADDSAVLRALGRSTIVIDSHCGRDFLLREETLRVDGSGKATLFLDDWPVVEVAMLRVDGYPIDAASYRLYGHSGYIRFVGGRSIFAGHPGTFPRGSQNIEITGRFGFETVPPEVKEAAILLTLMFLRMMRGEANVAEPQGNTTDKAVGIKRVKVDDLSVEFEYPRDVAVDATRRRTTGLIEADRLLWRYRRDIEAMVV